MVAVIKTSGSIRNTLHYNENKLKQKVAQLIHSVNYGKDTEQLGFTDKIKTLEKLASLNQRTKLSSVHISLNFDPSEKISDENLRVIAETYMQRIGFGAQPYLVYEHHDAGHPHLHIVTTNIQADGSRIKMQDIGRNQSEKARKEIEKEFRLVQAESHQLKQAHELKPVNVQKVQYGKSDTRRAITNVLDAILPVYKYASLPELNAILRGYNIVADRGSESSRTFKNNGLLYRILDDKGQKIGIPIKASAIYNKPTMKFLNEKFAQNLSAKQKHKQHVKNAVDLFFIKHPGRPLDELMSNLQKENIRVVLRQNDKGIIYGITYVDHQTKCVFNGSDLGREYSANQLQERLKQQHVQRPEQVFSQEHVLREPAMPEQTSITQAGDNGTLKIPGLRDIFYELTEREREGYLPKELREQQTLKRKRKKRLRH